MDSQNSPDASPIFDSLDVDIFVKVLAHTLFGFIKWCSRLYRNQRSFLFGPGKLDWGEQIVVITGGSSGVGELLANTLAVRNVNVVVLDVKPILTENYNITYYECDVSNWEEVNRVSKKVMEEIGEPTVLINNAGVVQGKNILDLEPVEVQQCVGLSPATLTPTKIKLSLADYCAAKAAVISLHESLRYELDTKYSCPQVRTTLVTPGHISTSMFNTVTFPDTAFHKFFFPSVQPVTVVKSIIAALDEQDSVHIYLPFYTNFAPYLRHLPSFLRDFAQWLGNPPFIKNKYLEEHFKSASILIRQLWCATKTIDAVNLDSMLSETYTECADVGFSSSTVQRDLAASAKSPTPSRRPRSNAITCPVSGNAQTFSEVVDNFNIPHSPIFDTAQDTSSLGGVEQSATGTLADAVENHLEHGPSMTASTSGDLSETWTSHVEAPNSLSAKDAFAIDSMIESREAASWPPQEEMLRNDQPYFPTHGTRHDALDATPCSSPLQTRDVMFDVAHDNETLHKYSYNRLNLILDSMFPDIAPHIVITPAVETWADEYIPWQNRVNPQWPHQLCVPPLDYPISPFSVLASSHLSQNAETLTQHSDATSPVALLPYSTSLFKQYNFAASPEHILTNDTVLLQKALCKDAFFATCDVARAYRVRYDSHPNVLYTIEPIFTWNDPAEPILAASHRMLGSTILDSLYPFVAPHIVINEPPPQPSQMTENNTTPYTQDAAFGDRLIVNTHYIEVINLPEDQEVFSFAATNVNNWAFESNKVDLSDSATESRPETPFPETPVGCDDDFDIFFARHDDDELDNDGLLMNSDYESVASIYGADSSVEDRLRAEKFQTTSRSMFYIDEDDDDLPSLDGW
ncbi:hypothetical protein H0H92_004877 [Tricholoma furcatifolium]|nr:hypothetical protein H0H92_004877 [Tricholoma furcatifolium]